MIFSFKIDEEMSLLKNQPRTVSNFGTDYLRFLNERPAHSKVCARVLVFNAATMSHMVSGIFGSNSECKIKV